MKRARDPDILRKAIDARDLTRRELAGAVGCSVGTLQPIIDGQATDAERARRIARVLRRPVGELFADVMSSGEPTIVDSQAIA